MHRLALLPLILLLALPLPSYSTGMTSPGQPVKIHMVSSPYSLAPAGYYRVVEGQEGLISYPLVSSGGYAGAAYRFLENPSFEEGRLHLALATPSGFIAWRVDNEYIKQVSPPVTLDNGTVAAAYATYNSTSKLDVYLAIADTMAGLRICGVASTGDWEEYPALGYLDGVGFIVYYYNSSDRDIYYSILDSSCRVIDSGRIYDGRTSYRYASQMAAASTGYTSLLVFRDYTGGSMNVYAILTGQDLTSQILELEEDADFDGNLPMNVAPVPGVGYIVPLHDGDAVRVYVVQEDGTVTSLGEWSGYTPATMPGVFYHEGRNRAYIYYGVPGGVFIIEVGPGLDTTTRQVELGSTPTRLYMAPEGSDAAIIYSDESGAYKDLLDLDTWSINDHEALGTGTPIGAAWTSNGLIALTITGGTTGSYLDLYAWPNELPLRREVLYTVPEDSDELLDPENPYGFLGLVNGAERSIYAVLAFFEREDLAEALVDAALRGVNVTVVVDDDSLGYPAVEYMANSSVRLYSDAGWEEETGYRHTMHEKFMVVDGVKVLIGTANPTRDGLTRDYQTILVLDNVPELAYALTVEAEDLANNGYGTSDGRDVYAGVAGVDEATGEVFTATVYQGPEHDLAWESRYVAHTARDNLTMAYYIFTTSYWVGPLRSEILAKAGSGVNVEAVFDWLLNEDTPGRFAYELYGACGCVAFSRGEDLMHAKTIVADYSIAATGSYNPTGSATRYNDEVLIVYTGPAARETGEWIHRLYTSWHSPLWTVDYHLVIQSFGIDPVFIVVNNPTSHIVDLTSYLIGDAERMFPRDDEALLSFPSGYLMPGDSVLVAYNASELINSYGVVPDYEIVDSRPDIPDLIPYMPDRFTGEFMIGPGDEVVLAMKSPYDPSFIYIIDMVPISPSTTLPVSPVDLPSPPYTSLSRLGSLDSIEPGRVFAPTSGPIHSGTVYIGLMEPGSWVTLSLGGAILNASSQDTQTVMLSLMRYMASTTPAGGMEYVAYDVYSNTTRISGVLITTHRPWSPETISAYYLKPSGWEMLPILDTSTYRTTVNITGAMGEGVPIVLMGSHYTPVVGGVASTTHTSGNYMIYLLAGLAILVLSLLSYKHSMT